jgi:hypothetical protein
MGGSERLSLVRNGSKQISIVGRQAYSICNTFLLGKLSRIELIFNGSSCLAGPCQTFVWKIEAKSAKLLTMTIGYCSACY